MVEPSKKQQKRKPKQGEDDDWEDDTFDKDALYEELDKVGPFIKNVSGVVEPESMILLKQVMAKHTYIAFTDRRNQILARRIEAYKNNDMRNYNHHVFLAGKEYCDFEFMVTKLAAEFIDLDEQNYEDSMRLAYEDREVAAQIRENEENIRVHCILPDSKEVSKEKAREMLIEKIKMDYECDKLIASYKPRSQEEAEDIDSIERTKVVDRLYMKHDIKYGDYQRALIKYDLENDEQVIGARNLIAAQDEKEQ